MLQRKEAPRVGPASIDARVGQKNDAPNVTITVRPSSNE